MAILESGMAEKWKKKYWTENNKCNKKTGIAATLENIIGTFGVLIVGITLSLATFMGEFLIRIISRKQYKIKQLFEMKAK